MTITSLARILGSMAMIIFASAVAAGATGAFFSDTETSTGNTFTAGSIDLQIDNESFVTDENGNLVASPNNTWGLSDLTNQLFFSFSDLKPGDIGEDTISVHAGANDAWACMAVDVTETPENALLSPEIDAGDTGEPGELQNYLEFAFWADDGDNVLEIGETVLWNGLAGSIFDGTWRAIADSSGNGFFANAITGDDTVHIGKAWCFGNLEQDAQSPGNLSPLDNTGFTCDGLGDQNDAQSDGIVADVSFYSEQSRNNDEFLCSELPPFTGDEPEDFSVTISSSGDDPVGIDLPLLGGSVTGSTTYKYVVDAVSSSGSSIPTVRWKITIDGPSTLSVGDVHVDEVGWKDPDEMSTTVFHYPTTVVSGDLVATGSCAAPHPEHGDGCATDDFDVDPNDDFTNVDSIHFAVSAPAGTYTIKRQLVNTEDGTPVSNELIVGVVTK